MSENHEAPPSDAIDCGWVSATEIASNPEGLLDRIDDSSLVMCAAHYVRIASSDGIDAAASSDPIVAKAVALQSDHWRLPLIKCYVIAYCHNLEIAEQLGLLPIVVHTWKTLFFDLDRAPSSCITRTQWLERHVMRREEDAGRQVLAAKMRLAYVTGSVGARAIQHFAPYEDGATNVLPYDEAQHLFHRRVELDRRWFEFATCFDHTLGVAAFCQDSSPLAQESLEYAYAVTALERRIRVAVRRHWHEGRLVG